MTDVFIEAVLDRLFNPDNWKAGDPCIPPRLLTLLLYKDDLTTLANM